MPIFSDKPSMELKQSITLSVSAPTFSSTSLITDVESLSNSFVWTMNAGIGHVEGTDTLVESRLSQEVPMLSKHNARKEM